MNRNTYKLIQKSIMNKRVNDHPNIPVHTIPIFRPAENSANALTQTIIKFLKAEGWQAERISNTGRFIADKFKRGGGTWIPGTGTPGTADISATIKGKSVKIEVKFKGDKQSPEQVKYQKSIEAAGGVYIIARNLDDFYVEYQKLIS